MGKQAAPLVSVVTPSYNSVAFIWDTIESVRGQDYPSIEHIVMDGGSTDGTLDVLRQYPHLTWVSGPDRGQSHALNKGFRQARGDVIGWLNADDTYQPGAIRTAVEYLIQHPAVMAVYGECRVVDRDGTPLEFYKTEDFDVRTLLLRDYIPQPAVFFRRVLFDGIGYLNESLHFVMDWEYWLRTAARYPMAHLDGVVLANLRVWDDCKSVDRAPEFDLEYLRVLEHLFQMPPYRDLPWWWRWRAVRLAKSRHHMATVFATRHHVRRAALLGHLLRGAFYNPGWLSNLGVLSIAVEALAGDPVARRLRRLARRVVAGHRHSPST
jgi:glycosyltransferase involved in cell wall biosynthesis